jgi:hypothetical protein
MQNTLTIRVSPSRRSWSVTDRALVINALHSELRDCEFSRIVQAVDRAARTIPANGERATLLANARQRLMKRRSRLGSRGLPASTQSTRRHDSSRAREAEGLEFMGAAAAFLSHTGAVGEPAR